MLPRLPVLAAVLAAVMSLPFSPALASSPDPEDGRHYRVDEVSYPLRHSFSMAVGLPGAGRHEPTSCYDVVGSDGHYLCRIVAGVEETGDRRNFFIPDEDALDDSDDESGRFGRQLVARDGIMFEGCKRWRSGDWFCDYASRRPVSRKHYDSDGYVLKVFWAWQSHTRGQAGCALAINAFWAKGFWSAFAPALNSCSNGPMERP